MRSERDMRCFRTSATLAAAFAILFAGGAAATQLVNNPALKFRVHSRLLLLDSELAILDVDTTPGVSQEIAVPLGVEDVVIEVAPHSTRSDDYQVKEQRADGSLVDVAPSPILTVRGTVKNLGGMVIGSIDEHGLTAQIILADDERYWIEPIAGRFPGATKNMHVVYNQLDAVAGGGTCATEMNRAAEAFEQEHPLAEGDGLGCDGLPCEVQLACDADVEYFTWWGSTLGVQNRINAIINGVNNQYETEVGITHVITTIVVRTAEPDPYTGTDAGALLDQLRNHWQQNHQDIVRDMTHLFTGRTLDPPPIGIAFTIGGICTSTAYCLVTNGETNFACVTDLSAHELGHLWGAQHCTCPGNTMNPSITCANRFGDLTIPSIVNHRESRLCLASRAPMVDYPFADQFNGASVDLTKWYNSSATVDDQGSGEPSAPSSLRLRGSADRINSGYMNATGAGRLGVEYFWQRTGLTGGSPEPGEDLLLEYKALNGQWKEGDRQLGDGADNLPYARACAILPEDADLEIAQIRLRMIAGTSTDNFFVDNLRVTSAFDFLNIVSAPEFDCACLNGSAQFSVTAEGEAPISYQWKRNGNNIPGATGSTLNLSNISQSDFTLYSVAVSNMCGTIESASTELVQTFTPSITLPPQNTAVLPGETIGLFVLAGGGCPEYHWFFNNTPVDGANSAFLFVTEAECADQGCYHVEVSNDCGEVTSAVAEVTVDGCGPLVCNVDSIAPVIVHASGLAGQTRPYSGYIDPRRESTDGVNFNQGITQVEILFSETVERIGGGSPDASSFIVTQTGVLAPPTVTAVNVADMPLVRLTLNRPLSVREWTTIRASVQDEADSPNAIVNVGNLGPGVNESDRVDIGFLPGDINQTSNVNPLDLLKFKQYVNNVPPPPAQGTILDFVDTNRSNNINPLDLLAFKQLVNGVIPPATQIWANKTMNSPRP